MSEIFCGTIKTKSLDFNLDINKNLDLKLYKIKLSKFQNLVYGTLDILSDSERSRANKYHFKKDRNRFIICRILLKVLLAKHIGLDVCKILIDTNINKKPYLPSHPSVFFNLTHAKDCAIIAIANSSIGVDIEYVDKNFDYNQILPTIFNKSEIDDVLKSNDKHQAFYQLWTRKEAIVKATGKGIDDHLAEITTLDGHHQVSPDLLGNIKRLNVLSFELDDGYLGAVAFSNTSEYTDKLFFYSIHVAFKELLNAGIPR